MDIDETYRPVCSTTYLQNLDLELPVMWLVSRLGIEHVLGLVKLLLLEGRILFFSNMAYKASSAVLALLTLVPGLYNQVRQRNVLAPWKRYGHYLSLIIPPPRHYEMKIMQPLLCMALDGESMACHSVSSKKSNISFSHYL